MKVLLAESIHKLGIDLLKEAAEVKIAKDNSEQSILEEIVDADALIMRSSPLPGNVIRQSKKLKVIGKHGGGVDNIDLHAANEMGVAVINVPDANILSVAEHTMTVILCLAKKIREAEDALRSGFFNQQASLPGMVTKYGFTALELCGKTLGIVGVGRIGRLTARIARYGFSMDVYGYDPYVSAEEMKGEGVEPVDSIDEIFRSADFISIHVPLDEYTVNLVNKELISLMKPTAFLINIARGGIVNEDDLYKALKSKTIAGAAVDVYEKEPPSPKHPLFELDNIIVTPHMAAMTDGALIRMAQDIAQGIIEVLNGRKPKHLINPEIWS